MNKGRAIIPIFIPHKGCPHDCSFCNQKKIAGAGGDVTPEDARSIIDEQLQNLEHVNKTKEIAFFGGSFTGLPRDEQVQFLKIANEKKVLGLIDDIRISTRPDYIDEDILELITSYGVSIIELGVQSTDDMVLKFNMRGHTKDDVVHAVSLIKAKKVQLGLQMMVGLYGDTEDKLLKTCADLISLKPDFVRIYPTIIIKDTMLEKLFLDGTYEPISLNEAVNLCKQLLLEFEQKNIPVIRLGLQTTDEITIGKSIVGGPYHPAFREIVESEIYKDIIEKQITKDMILKNNVLKISCNPKDCSKVSGYNQSNKLYLKQKYGFNKVRIFSNSQIQPKHIIVEI